MIYLGKEFAKLGEEMIYDTIRFYTMSIADFLGEYFESDLIKAHLSGSGIIGTALGVYSPGTAYVLLHHYMGEVDGSIGSWGFARGGMGAVSNALAAAFQAHGGEIITDAPVERVIVRNGKVAGVAHEERRRVPRRRSSSRTSTPSARSPKLFEEKDLARRSSSARATSRSAAPRASSTSRSTGCRSFPALGRTTRCASATCTSSIRSRRMERAYDDWKNGTWSKDPYLDLLIPSMTDPTMAPPGKHFMSVFVQYVPPKIHGRDWTDADRDGFGRR